MVSACPVCGGYSPPVPQFKVTYPDFGPGGRAGFALDEDPGVPFWTICRCPVCTVLYAYPRPTPDELAIVYENNKDAGEWEWQHYIEPSEETRRGWAEFAQRLTRLHGGPGNMLEIGCAAGWMLLPARDLGWSVVGVEPRPPFRNYARDRLGLQVVADGRWISERFDPFDLVCATDVIEHLQDPVADLRAIRRALKPSGYLVLATCDIESPDARRYGIHWRQVVISHTFYWTRKAMTIALKRSGFEVQSFSAFRYWDASTWGERARFLSEAGKYWVKRAIEATHFPPGLARRIAESGGAVLGDVMLVVARPTQLMPWSGVAEEIRQHAPQDAAQAAPEGAAAL